MILARDRHQLLPLLLGRCVEGDGQLGSHRLLSQFGDLRDDAGGGQSDAARRQTDALRIGEQPRRLDHVGKIEQRLSHPHHDEVQPARFRKQAVLTSHEKHLGQDLAGGKVPLEAHQRGHAELAVHRAAHLRRDADRIPPGLGHQNRFDGAPVFQFQQIALRAVGGLVEARKLGQADRVAGGEVPAQRRRERRDLHQVADLLTI